MRKICGRFVGKGELGKWQRKLARRRRKDKDAGIVDGVRRLKGREKKEQVKANIAYHYSLGPSIKKAA